MSSAAWAHFQVVGAGLRSREPADSRQGGSGSLRVSLEAPLTQLGEGNVGSLPRAALFATVAAYLKRDILGRGGKVLVPWSLLLSTDLGPGFELSQG